MKNESTDITVIVEHNPAIVLIDQGKRDDLFAHIQSEVDAFEPDLTTKKGRDAIKSLAFKITRTKTAIDAAGKKLNEEARAQINAVDSARRDARAWLDETAAKVRQPLTEWEEAEAARIEQARALIADIKASAMVTMEDTAASVRERGGAVWNTEIDADRLGDLFEEAARAKAETVETLKAALARLEKEEADRAELERLRAEAAERERIEEEKRAKEERKAREAEEQRLADERKAAAEKAEAERIERAKKEAAEAAEREAARKAQEERDRIEAEHKAALDAERRRAEEAEAAAKAERDRITAEDAQRKAEAERAAAEQAAREANQKHRRSVKTAVKEAIMRCGVSEDAAQKVVLSIIAGEVPNVTLRF